MAKGKVRGSDGEEQATTESTPLLEVTQEVVTTVVTPVYTAPPMKPLWSDVSVVQRGKES